mgnify:CR=1 FL=1
MSLRPAGFAPGYTGIGPTFLYGNDPHYDPLASRKVNPFSSLPLTGGRATVINDHLNAGPVPAGCRVDLHDVDHARAHHHHLFR